MAKKHQISSAREFAVRAHGARVEAGQPLAVHLDEVAVLVRTHGEVHQTVAYLHHVLEAPDVTVDQVEQEFGALVARCVGLLSGDPTLELKERRRSTYAGLATVEPDAPEAVALVVKVADRLANVQDCYLKDESGRLRKYRRDHRDFRAAVFRPGLADELWRELTELIAW